MTSLTSQLRSKADALRNRPQRDGWLRLPEHRETDNGVKPPPYLPIYEQLLGSLREQEFSLLELGVWGGHSLEMWRDAFPRATVVGVDLQPPEVDLGPRVHILAGDQSDPALMQRARDAHAPEGFQVIIDDASHLGITSARSLQALYREHLRPGGLYCIEDWGTGYLPDWPDGGPLRPARLDVANLDAADAAPEAEGAPAAMPSHDLGMVGLVKRLIDHSAAGSIRYGQADSVGEALEIETMSIWDGIVVLHKPGPASA
ncbi:MAG: class I SAM-dependent methyltransferase [Solirubrobacteraceae bacterium]